MRVTLRVVVVLVSIFSVGLLSLAKVCTTSNAIFFCSASSALMTRPP